MKLLKGSIRNKLIIFLLAAIILPISASILVSYNYVNQSIIQLMTKSDFRLLYQGKENIQNYFDFINTASLSVYNFNPNLDSLYQIIAYGQTNNSSHDTVYRTLQYIENSINGVEQVHVYISGDQSSYLMNHDILSSKSPVPTLLKTNTNSYNAYILPPHESTTYNTDSVIHTSNQKNVLSFVRPFYRIPAYHVLGFLSIDIKMDYFQSLLNQLYKPGKENLYILDEQGHVIFGPDSKEIGKRLQSSWVQTLLTRTADHGSLHWQDAQFQGIEIYQKMKTNYMNWIMVMRVPNQILYSNAKQYARINTLLVLFFLILVIVGTIYISFMLTKPLSHLIHSMNKVRAGDLNVEVITNSQDEIGILAHRFKTMMDTINHLFINKYQLEIENKTNQLKALQSQINPHFINNTLQSIGALALQNNDMIMYSLVSSLGKMMRYSMNTHESVVPLKEEINYIKAYLKLQQHRFDNLVKVEYDLDLDAMEIELPKMILQPLIENYFKHGFDQKSDSGCIRITTHILPDQLLQITVVDNGKGISENKLEQIQELMNQTLKNLADYKREGSIGLLNVLSRLKLFYSEQAEIRLKPVNPHGLSVELYIPLKKIVSNHLN